MKFILLVIVILLAASVLAQELNEKCYADCFEECSSRHDYKITCDSHCRELCTEVSRVTAPEKITTSKETPSCEDSCRERISSNYPDELNQCLQDCRQPPVTCEENCENQFRGVPVKIQACYIRECGHPRPALMSCEDVCRRDYGKDERQFQGCMAKRCLVTAYTAPAEVAPPPPPEVIAIMPRDEMLQPSQQGCPRQPESRCQRCENEYQECIGTLPEESQARQQGYDTCNAKVIRCLNGCLFGVVVEANEPTLKPRQELSQKSLWSRIWNSFKGK
jgi:hypothetical protein